MTAANGEGRQGLANAAVGRLLNMGFSTNKANQYIVLRALDLPTLSKKRFAEKYPELADRFKSDPLDPQIDAKDFHKVVKNAYSPDADGKEPLKKDANNIVRAYFDSIE